MGRMDIVTGDQLDDYVEGESEYGPEDVIVPQADGQEEVICCGDAETADAVQAALEALPYIPNQRSIDRVCRQLGVY